MAFKINISDKGKAYKIETDVEALVGKRIGEKIDGKEIQNNLEGYELEITGTSDKAGFPGMKDVEGIGLKKVLLKKGWGMKGWKKRGKKKVKVKGLRLKKTVRGNMISKDSMQINMKVIKQGTKKLEDIFPKPVKEETEIKVEEKK